MSPGRVSAAFLLFVVACSSSPKVHTTADPTADFGSYRTYAWSGADQRSFESVLSEEEVRRWIESSVEARLDRKGLSKVGREGSPDLLASYWLGSTEDIRLDQLPTSGPFRDSEGVTTQRTGSLIFDLVDAKSGRAVWRASVEGELTREPAENTERLGEALDLAFARFPAGRK